MNSRKNINKVECGGLVSTLYPKNWGTIILPQWSIEIFYKNFIKPIAKTSLLKYNKDVLGCKGENYEIYW